MGIGGERLLKQKGKMGYKKDAFRVICKLEAEVNNLRNRLAAMPIPAPAPDDIRRNSAWYMDLREAIHHRGNKIGRRCEMTEPYAAALAWVKGVTDETPKI